MNKRIDTVKKIVFMGTPQFSVPILQALAETYDVVGVVTQPDRPVGRKRVLTPTPVKKAALELNIPVFQPEKISGSETMERIINDIKPDIIVTAAFGQFLPTKLLEAPSFGAINVHASLLPKYRGGAPIHYAVMAGEKETGITIMYMERKMDAGDIISQRAIPITNEDDTGTMFDKLSVVGRDLLMDTLPDLFAGTVTALKQNEDEVTYSPNITREQEKIDWTKTAEAIDWKVRGLRPFPGTYSMLDGDRMKIWASRLSEKETYEKPGTMIGFTENSIEVACGENTVLELIEIQPAGKGRMDVKDYLLGAGQSLKEGLYFD